MIEAVIGLGVSFGYLLLMPIIIVLVFVGNWYFRGGRW